MGTQIGVDSRHMLSRLPCAQVGLGGADVVRDLARNEMLLNPYII